MSHNQNAFVQSKFTKILFLFCTFAKIELYMADSVITCPFKVGNGYDVHALGEGIQMWLGGIPIDSPVGFIAHSDGDVAIHALCDALLGCLALGDIGHHFPDNSDEFKGIDSKILLDRVVKLIEEKGWAIGNVDITIALQRPKIAAYVPKMRECLAQIMNLGTDCVSVKATTTEKMGFVGRCEGCQVWANAIIYRKDQKK